MELQQLAAWLELTFWQVLIRVMSAPGLRRLSARIGIQIKDKGRMRLVRLAAAWSISGWLLGILFGLLTIILQSTR
jgi:hypothetical protein